MELYLIMFPRYLSP